MLFVCKDRLTISETYSRFLFQIHVCYFVIIYPARGFFFPFGFGVITWQSSQALSGFSYTIFLSVLFNWELIGGTEGILVIPMR